VEETEAAFPASKVNNPKQHAAKKASQCFYVVEPQKRLKNEALHVGHFSPM
jgi:hypothetical protein